MSWDHRVVKHTAEHGVWYGIHEVFYSPEMKPVMYTQDPVYPFGETMAEMRHSWFMMISAFNKPILDEKTDLSEESLKENSKGTWADQEQIEKEIQEGETISHEEFRKQFGLDKITDEQRQKWKEEEEEERIFEEVKHQEVYVGDEDIRRMFDRMFEEDVEYRKKHGID